MKTFAGDKLLYRVISIAMYLTSISLNCLAQQKALDSLLAQLSTTKNDSDQVKTLAKVSMAFLQSNRYDSALTYSMRAVKIADDIRYNYGIAFARSARAAILVELSRYAEAKRDLTSAIDWWKQSGDELNLAIDIASMGSLCGREENYAEALRFYYESLPLLKHVKDTGTWARSLNGIGTVYYLQKNFDEALKAYNEALMLAKAKGVQSEVAKTHSDIGGVYFKQGKYDSAEVSCTTALSIYETLQDVWGISYANSVLGNIYERQGELLSASGLADKGNLKYQQALHKYYSMHQMLQSLQNTDGIAEASLYLGNLFSLMHKTDSARRYFNDCLTYSLAIGKKQYARDAHLGLYRIDSSQAQYKQALFHFKKFTGYRDSVVNEESLRKSDQHKADYEIALKKNEIKLLSAENELKTALAQKENQRKNFALVGIGIVTLAGGYGLYWFRKKKQFQNEQNLMDERLRISRELHDEVGATLSGVAMYSHLTKTQLQAQDITGVENSLAVMQDSSAQMVNKLNDIVWLINPDRSSLPDLIQRLEEYARKMSVAKHMEVSVHVYEAIHQHQLTMEQRRNIYLFCKEAINNAVKYSGGDLLELNVKEDGGLLEFSVRDNGKGFDPGTIKRGNGSGNFQQRANETGAEYILHTSKGNGCKVSLQLKIT